MKFSVLLTVSLLLGIGGGFAQADADRSRPRARTLATSSASYARQLHQWFPKEIRLRDRRKPGAVAVSPRNLCKSRDLDLQREEDTSVIVGSVAIGALPAELGVGEEAEPGGEYRVAAFGYVIPVKGNPIWAGEATTPGKTTAPASGRRSLGFSVTLGKPKRGAALLLIVVGEPIATRRGDAGGAVILGSCVRAL